MNCFRLFALVLFIVFNTTATLAHAGAIRILIGFPPGASGDAMARKIAEKMQAALGEAVLVDNRPGAGGRIALEQLKLAKPDGRTLIFTPMTPLASAPWLYTVNYDSSDFKPVAHVAYFKYVFVVNDQIKADSLSDFISMARVDQRLDFYSASAPGGGAHMALDAFARSQKLDLTFVGYKGTANAVTDLLAGHLPTFIGNVADFVELVKQGKVKALGVTSRSRATQLPEIPTFKEQGFDIEADGWFAMYAPARTPEAAVARLSKAIIDAVRAPDVKALGDSIGLEMTGLGPVELAAIQKRDLAMISVKASGFKPNN